MWHCYLDRLIMQSLLGINRSMSEMSEMSKLSPYRSILHCIPETQKNNIEMWNLLLPTQSILWSWHFSFSLSCQSSFWRLGTATSRSSAAAARRSRCLSCRRWRKPSSRHSTQMSAWERGWPSASTCLRLAYRWEQTPTNAWLQTTLHAWIVHLWQTFSWKAW